MAQNPDFSVNRFGIQVRGSPGIAYYVDGFRIFDPNLIDVKAVQGLDVSATDIDCSYGEWVSGLVGARTVIGKTGGHLFSMTDDLPGRGDLSNGENLLSANLGYGRSAAGLQADVSGRLMTTDSYEPAFYPLPAPGLEDNLRARVRWLFADHVSNINVTALRGRTQFMVWNPYDDVGNNWKYAEHEPMRLFKNHGFGISGDWRVRANMLVSLRTGRFTYEIFDGNRDFAWDEANGHAWYDDYRLKAEHLIPYLEDGTFPYRDVLIDSLVPYHRMPDMYSPEALRKNPYGTANIFFTVGDYPLWSYRNLVNIQAGADYYWVLNQYCSLKLGGGYDDYKGSYFANFNPGWTSSSYAYDTTDPGALVSGYGQIAITYKTFDVDLGLRIDHHQDYEWVLDSTSGFPPLYVKVYHTHASLSPYMKMDLKCATNMDIILSAAVRHHAQPNYPIDAQPQKIVDWNIDYRANWRGKIWFEFNPYLRHMSDFIVNTTSLAAYYPNYYEPDQYPMDVSQAKAYGATSRAEARLDNAYLTFSYNLQKTESGEIEPYQNPYGDTIWIGSIDPLSYGRRDALSLTMAYEFPSSYSVKILRYFSWSLTVSKQAGLRYTPQDLRGNYLGDPNSAAMPSWTDVDLSVGKKIIAGPVAFNVFAVFTNLFNNQQVINVYPMTGDPLDHGDQIPNPNQFGSYTIMSRYYSPQGDSNHDGVMTQVESHDEYIHARTDLYDDPTHFNPGFGFRLGAGIEF